MARLRIVLAAGGTGGHLFPALSVAQVMAKEALQKGEQELILFTDERAQEWARSENTSSKVTRGGDVGASVSSEGKASNSASPSKSSVVHTSPFARIVVSRFSSRTSGKRRLWAFAFRLLACGLKSLGSFLVHRPAVVVGFGGYPSAPVVFAARLLRIPTVLHECNATLGRANALLLGGAKALTMGFDVSVPQAKNVPVVFTGNPVREAIACLREASYQAPEPQLQENASGTEKGDDAVESSEGAPFRLLVIGGSQGSALFSKVIPEALRQLCLEHPSLRLEVQEQVRAADLPRVQEMYRDLPLQADLRPFFEDMALRLSQAHLVIARSGALTLAELAAVGKPSILIPLGCSVSGDQAANAKRYKQTGASVVIEEGDLTPEALKDLLASFMRHPEPLTAMSQAARALFVPQASERLVHVIQKVVLRKPLSEETPSYS